MCLRRILRIVIPGLAVVLVAGTFLTVRAWRDLHRRVRPLPGTVVVVPRGASLKSVATRLLAAGLLRQRLPFVLWARYSGRDRSIRSGTYRLAEPVSPVELLARLTRGPVPETVWVTIPEGYTARQVAQALESAGLGGRDVYRCAMQDVELLAELGLPASGVEGYLFPDTYAFSRHMTPRAVVRAMVARFRRESAALAGARLRAGMSEVEMVTLASVIEKETGRAEERAHISGVFHNRLRRGMLLQSDPTVIYGLRNFNGNLTRADLTDSSPYNTYVHRGLPPGPIANPGAAALAAAVHPAPTRDLYFVARGDGSHQFSPSLAAHNRAVRRYQKRRRRRPGRRRGGRSSGSSGARGS